MGNPLKGAHQLMSAADVLVMLSKYPVKVRPRPKDNKIQVQMGDKFFGIKVRDGLVNRGTVISMLRDFGFAKRPGGSND